MILIVEDNPEMAQVFERALVKAGFPIDIAGTGEDALKALATGKYDLVLMDVLLPGIDGSEVARRARDAGCAVPMIAISGAIEPESPDFVAWMGKPLRISALIDLVRQYVTPAAADPNP